MSDMNISDKLINFSNIKSKFIMNYTPTNEQNSLFGKITIENIDSNNKFDRFMENLTKDKKGTYNQFLELFDFNGDNTISTKKIWNVDFSTDNSEKQNLIGFLKVISGKEDIPSKKDFKNFINKLNNLDKDQFNILKNCIRNKEVIPGSIATELDLNKSHMKLRKTRKEENLAGKNEILDVDIKFQNYFEIESESGDIETVVYSDGSFQEDPDCPNKIMQQAVQDSIDYYVSNTSNHLEVEKFKNSDAIKKQTVKDKNGNIILEVTYNQNGQILTKLEFAKNKCAKITFANDGDLLSYNYTREILSSDMRKKYLKQSYDHGVLKVTETYDNQGRISEKRNYVGDIRKYFYNNDTDNSCTMLQIHKNNRGKDEIDAMFKYDQNGLLTEETRSAEITYDKEGNIKVTNTDDTVVLKHEYNQNNERIKTTEYHGDNVRTRVIENNKITYFDEEGKEPLYYTLGEYMLDMEDFVEFHSYEAYTMDGQLIKTFISPQAMSAMNRIETNLNKDDVSINDIRKCLYDIGLYIDRNDMETECYDKIIAFFQNDEKLEKFYSKYFSKNPQLKKDLPNIKNLIVELLNKFKNQDEGAPSSEDLLTFISSPKLLMAAAFRDIPNGKIDKPHYQGNAGDCWFLETINSFARTTEGKAILESLISVDKKTGDVTVSLEGRNKKYRIPIKDLSESSYYSRGDAEVRALELALLQYYQETGQRSSLEGGKHHDVLGLMKIFTGKEQINDVKKEGDNLVGNIDGENVVLVSENLEKFKNRPFLVKPSKENLEALRIFKGHIALEFGLTVGVQGHEYSFEFNDDGTISLHEPHNSTNSKIMTLDEFCRTTLITGDINVIIF